MRPTPTGAPVPPATMAAAIRASKTGSPVRAPANQPLSTVLSPNTSNSVNVVADAWPHQKRSSPASNDSLFAPILNTPTRGTANPSHRGPFAAASVSYIAHQRQFIIFATVWRHQGP